MLKTFKIGSLFYKPDLRFSSDHAFDKQLDLSKKESDEFSIPVVNAKHGNNGVMYFGRPSDFQHVSNSIDIVADGASSTGDVYYQRSDTGVLYNSYLIRLKDSRIADNHFVVAYLTTVLRKRIKGFFGYENKATWDRIKELNIDLPVTDSGQLDVQYMEQYIKRIEAQYIKRIEAYLSVLGYDSIDDCELSSQDLKLLSGPDEWGEFRIGSLFKKLSSRYLGSGNKFDAVRKKPSAEFSLPVTYAKYNNNGIMYWGRPADFQHYRNCISVIYNGAVSAGLVFAQKDDTGVLAESYLIDFKNYHNESFKVDLYISAVMKKALYPLYSRENLAVWSKVKDNMIKLPVTPDGKPDYDFMDQYITAIEKKKVLKLKQAMDHKLDLYWEMSHQD